MCGIGGAWGRGAADAVAAMEPWLRHRGQEGVGYAYSLAGSLALGRPPEEAEGALVHTRYSTTGPYGAALQPVLARHRDLELAVAFNGTIVNYRRLADGASFDGEALARALAREVWELGLEEGVRAVFGRMVGAASLVALTPWGLLAVRDPRGVRPLAVAQAGGLSAAASETVALDGGVELPPGVAVLFGRRYAMWKLDVGGPAVCALEYVYFSHPASLLGGRRVADVRRALGRALAEGEDAELDAVAYIPESAREAAAGYAEALGLPLVEAVVKARSAGRLFIAPPHARSAHRAFRAVRELAAGRRLALVDDSLIRGTNVRAVVRMLREAGAREVHVRIASPPVRWPCFLGMDFQTRRELAAHGRDLEDVRQLIGADSLRYLDLNRFASIIGPACYGCFTGRYPLQVDVEEAERELGRLPTP